MKRLLSITLLSLLAATSIATHAAGDEVTLTIKNHAFEPREIRIPAGKKIRLRVVNQDAVPAEFESKPLGREKIIPGKASATILIGPLKPGRYSFVEEYHENDAAAQGTIIVE